jgi:hypothetical protein
MESNCYMEISLLFIICVVLHACTIFFAWLQLQQSSLLRIPASLLHADRSANAVWWMVMQFAHVRLIMLEHLQVANLNVLWAQNVLRTKHVSTRNVWTLAQALVVLMLAVRLWITIQYVVVTLASLVIPLQDVWRKKVSTNFSFTFQVWHMDHYACFFHTVFCDGWYHSHQGLKFFQLHRYYNPKLSNFLVQFQVTSEVWNLTWYYCDKFCRYMFKVKIIYQF